MLICVCDWSWDHVQFITHLTRDIIIIFIINSVLIKRIIIYISMRWQLWIFYDNNVGKSSCSEDWKGEFLVFF